MTRSFLLAGVAILIAVPAQAGGVPGGLAVAEQNNAGRATAKAAGNVGATMVGKVGRDQAGLRGRAIATTGLAGSARANGIGNSIRSRANAAIVGSVHGVGNTSSSVRGKLGSTIGLAGRISGDKSASVRGKLGTAVGLVGRVKDGASASVRTRLGSNIGLAGRLSADTASSVGRKLNGAVGLAGRVKSGISTSVRGKLGQTVGITGHARSIAAQTRAKVRVGIGVGLGLGGKANRATADGKLLTVKTGGSGRSLASAKIGTRSKGVGHAGLVARIDSNGAGKNVAVRVGAGSNSALAKAKIGSFGNKALASANAGNHGGKLVKLKIGSVAPARLPPASGAIKASGSARFGASPAIVAGVPGTSQGAGTVGRQNSSPSTGSPTGQGSTAGSRLSGGDRPSIGACRNDTAYYRSGMNCHAN